MNIIEIEIGNKKHKISCEPGEEQHIRSLSLKLNERYKSLSQGLGPSASESLILVIMSLMQEDEIENLQKNKPSNSTSQTTQSAQPTNQISPEKLLSLTNRIDSTIKQLEDLKKAS